MSTFITLLVFSIIGLAIALYLAYKRVTKEKPYCLIGEDCTAVLSSKYSNILGVHNDVAGAGFYVALLLILFMLRADVGPTDLLILAMKLMSGAGIGMGLILLFVQWKVIRAWCFWCIVSDLNTWLVAYIIFTKF